MIKYGIDIGTGAIEEDIEYLNLENECEQGNKHYKQRVDSTLHHYGTQSFRERNSIVTS